MKSTRRIALLTPITLAAGLLVTVVAASAADTRWTSTGAQQPGSADRPVWSIAVSPAHPAVLLAATQGRGVLRSADSGTTWSSVIAGIEGAWVVRFDPLQPATAYAGTQTAGLYKSVDEGKTWTAQNQGMSDLDVRSIDLDTGLVVAGTARGVYYSIDGAGSWHLLGLDGLDISAVAVLAKSTGVTLFAGADNGSAGSGYLLKSEGLGGSWAVVKGNFPADAVVASLAVGSAPSGGTERPVLAGTSQGLFRSDDRGVTWSPLSGLPTTDFNLALFNPANPDQIYVGSDGDQGNGSARRRHRPVGAVEPGTAGHGGLEPHGRLGWCLSNPGPRRHRGGGDPRRGTVGDQPCPGFASGQRGAGAGPASDRRALLCPLRRGIDGPAGARRRDPAAPLAAAA